MSKERELLERSVRIIESLGADYEAYNLIDKIGELLAQPEQTEQDFMLRWYRKGYKQGFVDGKDIPHRRFDYFTDIILGGKDHE